MSVASPMKVVVVDDDGDLRKVLSLTLELDGRFKVVGLAATAAAALHVVAVQRPDAVLLDVALPDVPPARRLHVVEEICEVVPHSTVIVFTGRVDDELEARVLAAGGTAVVTKGAGSEALIEALLRVPRLRVGAGVAVRNTFSGAWQPGFIVIGSNAHGYLLQRGDGFALPGPVEPDRVRSDPPV